MDSKDLVQVLKEYLAEYPHDQDGVLADFEVVNHVLFEAGSADRPFGTVADIRRN